MKTQPFTEQDFYAFAGVEGANPMRAFAESGDRVRAVIVSDTGVDIIEQAEDGTVQFAAIRCARSVADKLVACISEDDVFGFTLS